jgi:hypothetical protein
MKNLKYFLLLISALYLIACEEVIEFDLNNQENSRLVVEGNLTDQTKAHVVKLTRTSSYYENQQAPLETGATVTLSDGTSIHTLTETSQGIYETLPTYKGEIGKSYTLTITTSNFDTYSATSTLNPVANIDTIMVDMDGGIKGPEDHFLAFKHFGPEPPTLGNNYMWLIEMNGENLTSTATEITFVTDEFVNGNYIGGFIIHEIEEKEIPLVDSLKIEVELHSISREYHDFLMAVVMETEFSGSIFSGPPANIPSNISNGGLGFFRASAVNSKYIEIENPLY